MSGLSAAEIAAWSARTRGGLTVKEAAEKRGRENGVEGNVYQAYLQALDLPAYFGALRDEYRPAEVDWQRPTNDPSTSWDPTWAYQGDTGRGSSASLDVFMAAQPYNFAPPPAPPQAEPVPAPAPIPAAPVDLSGDRIYRQAMGQSGVAPAPQVVSGVLAVREEKVLHGIPLPSPASILSHVSDELSQRTEFARGSFEKGHALGNLVSSALPGGVSLGEGAQRYQDNAFNPVLTSEGDFLQRVGGSGVSIALNLGGIAAGLSEPLRDIGAGALGVFGVRVAERERYVSNANLPRGTVETPGLEMVLVDRAARVYGPPVDVASLPFYGPPVDVASLPFYGPPADVAAKPGADVPTLAQVVSNDQKASGVSEGAGRALDTLTPVQRQSNGNEGKPGPQSAHTLSTSGAALVPVAVASAGVPSMSLPSLPEPVPSKRAAGVPVAPESSEWMFSRPVDVGPIALPSPPPPSALSPTVAGALPGMSVPTIAGGSLLDSFLGAAQTAIKEHPVASAAVGTLAAGGAIGAGVAAVRSRKKKKAKKKAAPKRRAKKGAKLKRASSGKARVSSKKGKREDRRGVTRSTYRGQKVMTHKGRHYVVRKRAERLPSGKVMPAGTWKFINS